jgi:hypothetical protein
MHIASEIVVVSCLVIWMSGYRKRTTSQLEKLLLRIEEQDEKIQKLEQQFIAYQQQQRLSSVLSSIPVSSSIPVPNVPKQTSKPSSAPPVPPKTQIIVVPSASPPESVPPPIVQVPSVAPKDEDLDALIQDELAELIAGPAPPTDPPAQAVLADGIEEISTDAPQDLKKKES